MLQFPTEKYMQSPNSPHVKRVSKTFSCAMEKLQAGSGITPQMWKIFPRLRALSKSYTSEVYSVKDLMAAKMYLLHPVLGKHLTDFCEAVLDRPNRKDAGFLTPRCAMELQASMTLFSMAGGENTVFHRVLEEFFDGETDPRTVARLTKEKALIIRDGMLLDCFGYSGDLVIPEGVTAIDERAFYNCEELHSVVLPDGLECIGAGAFYNCCNLVSVHLPETVTKIDNSAFACCVSLREITLPENLKELGRYAFYNCDSLTSINIPKHLRGVNTGAFNQLCLLSDKNGNRHPEKSSKEE